MKVPTNKEANYTYWTDDSNHSYDVIFTPPDETHSQGIVHGIFLIVFTIIGGSFSAFMIIAIVPNRRLRTVRNILLVHLGIVGLASSILTTLYAGVVSLMGYWVGGKTTCQMYGFLNTTLTLVSVWTIAALSWDKYQTIASPLHHSLTATARKMTSLFSVFWLMAIVCALPPLVGANDYVFYPVTGTCFVNHLDTGSQWYVAILVGGLFYVPLIVMVYCYTHIFRIARTQSSRIAATMVRMACVVQAPIAPNTPTSTPLSASIKGTKAMMTILQLVGAFTVTYIPYSIVILVETFHGARTVNALLASVVTTLFQAAPMTNSAIYGIRNKILRNSFARYMRRKIQLFCYKDRRRGSVKSLSKRSSSFKMSLMQRKAHQNGNAGPLRRTQSLQVKHLAPRSTIVKFESSENIRKTHSFTLSNGHALIQDGDNVVNCVTPDFSDLRRDFHNLRKISDVAHEPTDPDHVESEDSKCQDHIGNN